MFTVILTPHGVHWHLQTHNLKYIYKSNLIHLSQVHYNEWNSSCEKLSTRVCIKVLSCDPKGDHVISKYKPTEIYQDLLYLTNLTETFHTLTLHSFLCVFAIERDKSSGCFSWHVWGGISGRAQFTHTTWCDAMSDVTRTYCARRLGAQWTRAQIKHRR